MLRKDFNKDWLFSRGGSLMEFFFRRKEEPIKINLPHDAMILEARDKNCKNGSHTGYFPGGVYTYTKKFFVPEEYKNKIMIVEFEGVYMNAMVYVNGALAGKCPYGYSNFYVKLDKFLNYGSENEIKVVVKNSAEPNSRWYSGSGIYRYVRLIEGELLHIGVDGVKITTLDIDKDEAVIEVMTVLENESLNTQQVLLKTDIKDSAGNVVTSDSTKVTVYKNSSAIVRQRLYIENPKLWSLESPNLYYCHSKMIFNERVIDEDMNYFGIRKLQLTRKEGLKLNGEIIKLRGACIHHDNGVVGACSFKRAEERRVKILKEAGFNAIRMAHNPASKELLNACDRLGMLVMDEAFDAWNISKTDYDYGNYFAEWWKEDIKRMIDKDYNHPSVIIYSIGNEIPDIGNMHGGVWAREIAEYIRSLDKTRYITSGVNGLIAISTKLEEFLKSIAPQSQSGENQDMAEAMRKLMVHPVIGEITEEIFSVLDIAGYNYMESRYEMDGTKYPNRIICGTETAPPSIDRNWKLVKANSYVIGDFTWTGWDYIGEAGVGKIEYDSGDNTGFFANYPWYIANCGDIDICGFRRPQSFYREIVWGLRKEPYIAVENPAHYGKKPIVTQWSWTDVTDSWTWQEEFIGKPIKVEVYSSSEFVELYINGKLISKKPAGEENRFKANFETVYEPGEILAISYTNGKEDGRASLKTAGPPEIIYAKADKLEMVADGDDLVFIELSLLDKDGVINQLDNKKIRINIKGPGIIQGFGSADPKSTENFYDRERTTYHGKALAVIRSTLEPGEIEVTFEAEGCKPAKVNIVSR
ncbi:glycoside hydrolase family 2 protein [bacterium]|nr:glycoside hydrolase family 2 protein [bacterium]